MGKADAVTLGRSSDKRPPEAYSRSLKGNIFVGDFCSLGDVIMLWLALVK